jgi:ABC-type multidrug transport system fused ATPase/permease subunit
LLSLITRLHDPDAGRVLLNGTDVRHLSLRSLHEQVAVVPQDPWLISGTIADNIAYGRADATAAAVRSAGQLALVDEFADQLPGGWGSEVGEGGAVLSGGQRRRVAIARAVVAARPVLLLDEPTAGLDAASKQRVVQAIGSVAQGRTVIIATHDFDLAEIAARVVVLGKGAAQPEPAEAPQPARLFPAEVASWTSVFSTRAPHGPDDASTPVLLDEQ